MVRARFDETYADYLQAAKEDNELYKVLTPRQMLIITEQYKKNSSIIYSEKQLAVRLKLPVETIKDELRIANRALDYLYNPRYGSDVNSKLRKEVD